MAQELETFARLASRLEAGLAAELDLANRSQVREEIETLNAHIARVSQRFSL